MHTYVSGAGTAGTNRVEQFQLSGSAVDGKGADRAFVVFTLAVRFIGRIQTGPCSIQCQATRTGAHLMNTARGHGPCGAIHLKQVNAAAISRGQIHLG